MNEIAAVKMEVQRNDPPDPDFLVQIRALCDQYNAVLIFDECTSGFRETMGGLHLKYGVNPDIAMFVYLSVKSSQHLRPTFALQRIRVFLYFL